MLTKPDIADELINSRLQDEYGLRVISLTFLPLGADMGTAVYRVVARRWNGVLPQMEKRFQRNQCDSSPLSQVEGDSRDHCPV